MSHNYYVFVLVMTHHMLSSQKSFKLLRWRSETALLQRTVAFVDVRISTDSAQEINVLAVQSPSFGP